MARTKQTARNSAGGVALRRRPIVQRTQRRSPRSLLLESQTAIPISEVARLLESVREVLIKDVEESRRRSKEQSCALDNAQDILFSCLPGYESFSEQKDDAAEALHPWTEVFYDNDKWYHLERSCASLSKFQGTVPLYEARKKKMKASWCCTWV